MFRDIFDVSGTIFDVSENIFDVSGYNFDVSFCNSPRTYGTCTLHTKTPQSYLPRRPVQGFSIYTEYFCSNSCISIFDTSLSRSKTLAVACVIPVLAAATTTTTTTAAAAAH